MSTEDKSKSKSDPILVTTTPADPDTNYDNVFEGIHNFRDVGVTINNFLGKRYVAQRLALDLDLLHLVDLRSAFSG